MAKAKTFKRAVEDPGLGKDQDVEMPWGGGTTKGAYFLWERGYEPAKAAAKLDIPIFVLQGKRDYQITMKDFEIWQKGLSGKKNAKFQTYETLNHLFVSGTGPPSSEEYERPGHVDEAVIRDIAAWITGRS